MFGNSTAGGAYVPGMCDYSVLVDQHAKVFLGGPPLVKMATGEESDDEELGGAAMHSRVSGLADYFARDELDCIRIGRKIVADLELAQARARHRAGPPTRRSTTPRSSSASPRSTSACRSTRVRCSPASSTARGFDEYKPTYGISLVTGWASIHGYPVGVLANARGVLFMEEAKKATEFILLAQPDRHPARVPPEHHRLHGRAASTSRRASSRTAPR